MKTHKYHNHKTPNKTPFSAQEDAHVIEWRAQGVTIKEIGRRLNRSESRIKKRITQLKPLSASDVNRLEDRKILDMLSKGAKAKEIAAAVGMKENSVHKRVAFLRIRDNKPYPFLNKNKKVMQKKERDPAITDEDKIWMDYWRQTRAVRRQQQIAMADAQRDRHASAHNMSSR